jgi:DNA-binding response OmpR family regulator
LLHILVGWGRASEEVTAVVVSAPEEGRIQNGTIRGAVVVITARPNQLFTALAAGVGALLEKPLHIPKMLQTISRLLRESVETRLARVAGKVAQFHYLPAWPETQAGGIAAIG